MFDDVYYQEWEYNVNHGLKIDDVVRIKRTIFYGVSLEKDYIIDHVCNGLVSIKDSNGVLYLDATDNLICTGHVEKCIQFKDKSLCLI